MFKNYLKIFFKYFLIVFACNSATVITSFKSCGLLLVLATGLISLLVALAAVSLDATQKKELTKSEMDRQLENTAEDFFSRLSDTENESLGRIIKYVQDHGGGETYLEMDENQKMRLRTTVKEHNTDITVDLGTIELPSPRYAIESADWKLDMEKIFDNLSVRLKATLGDNYK